jgi:hypothetical protein
MVNPFFTAPTLNTIPAPAPVEVRKTFAPQIVDYVSSGNGYTVARMSDGTTQTLRGTRADRNNNPGNLTGTLAGAQRRGAIAVDHGGNYIFPTAEAGRRAMAEMVLNENANKSIGDMLNMYAPPGAANDPNDTNRLYPGLIAQQGFNLGDRVGALPSQQQQALLGAMMGVEGYSGTPAAAPPAAPMNMGAVGVNPQKNFYNDRIVRMAQNGNYVPPGAGSMQALGMQQANAQFQAQEAPAPQGGGGGGGFGSGGGPRMAVGAGRAEAQELGLFGNPQVANAVAETTASAVDKVSASDEAPKPLTKKERERFSPRSLGLIAFGLSLMGGADISDAMQNGVNIYEGLQNRKDRKERQAAIDALIAKQDPETQEVLRLLGDDAKAIATYIGGREQRKAAEAEAQAQQAQFAGDIASRDLTPQIQQRVANAKDPADELVKIDEESRQVKGNLATMQSTHDRILSDIDAIRQMVGGEFYNDETGQIETVSGMSNDGGLNFFNNFDGLVPLMANIPLTRTKAKDYKQRLDTLKANIGFGELQRMRDNSPTGSALGQVTELELKFLQNVLGAIGTDTKYETLLQTLDKAEQVYREMLSAAQADYANYYGAPQTNGAGAGQTFSFGGSSYEVQ